jgi:peptidoglycan-N-acetylglucosamine deacetylase
MPIFMNPIKRKLLDISARNITGSITHVATDKRIASLTFDDGPHPVYTPMLLEILKKYDAHATFFMSGEGAHNHPDIVKKVASAGHAIGNHSWNHHAFTLLTMFECWEQIRKCKKVLKPYGLPLFRPPYGLNNNKSNMVVFLQGYKVVGWSIDSKDWCEPNSEKIENNLLTNIKPGSIILFHDRIFDGGKPQKGPIINQEVITDREPMLFALKGLLERIKTSIQFVTIPVLLRNGCPIR